MRAPVKLYLASSNPGKRSEYQSMVAGGHVELASLPGIDARQRFDESAPTFAENAAGKALHYSRATEALLLADDSGLVVPALGGAPGPQSARYAGPRATDADRIRKLLDELQAKGASDRQARFVCVLALAAGGRVLAVFSDAVEGTLLPSPRGTGGFGYDPLFLFEPLGKTFAELSREEKNRHSHRGKAFRKLLAFVTEELR